VSLGSRPALVLIAFAAAGWLTATVGQASPQRSLYARLGGEPVAAAFVSDTIDQVVAYPRLNQSFQGVDTQRIKRLIVELICELAGGGCHYDGDSMRVAHANLHITSTQFDGLVEILRKQMRRHHVGLPERNELLALLAPMKRDIVDINVPPPPRPH
jgi:hemoglobin